MIVGFLDCVSEMLCAAVGGICGVDARRSKNYPTCSNTNIVACSAFTNATE